MTKKKVWRYYCEHCKKSGCSGASMSRHEKGCTANPNRSCGHCREAGLPQHPMADLIKALGNGNESGVDNLRELSEGCPACMLAAIRQSGLQRPWSYDGEGFRVKFDFKAENIAFWTEINNDRAEHDSYSGY